MNPPVEWGRRAEGAALDLDDYDAGAGAPADCREGEPGPGGLLRRWLPRRDRPGFHARGT